MSQQQQQQSLAEWFLSTSSAASCSSSSTSASPTVATANTAHYRRIMVLDGGVSTHLQEIMPPGSSFSVRQLWSSSLLLHQQDHDLVAKGHRDWLEAGANVITTVTYQCHFQKDLWPTLTTKDALVITDGTIHQLWKDGIALAKRAVREYQDSRYNSTPTATTTTSDVSAKKQEAQLFSARPLYVVASSGCYGAALANGAEYTGDYNHHNNSDMMRVLQEFHQKKIASALKHQPDGIAIETIPSLLECQALKELFCSSGDRNKDSESCSLPPGVACWISLACQNATQLNDGSTVQEALACLFSIPTSQLQAIGFNCCDSVYLNDLAKIITTEMALHYNHNQNYRRGIVLYPNSGEIWEASTESWKQGTGTRGEEDVMADRLVQIVNTIETTWKQLRPNDDDVPRILIGGCCRTQPSTIASLQRRVEQHLQKTHE